MLNYLRGRQTESMRHTPDISRSHIWSPYSDTTCLHSMLTSPSAPIALWISASIAWRGSNYGCSNCHTGFSFQLISWEALVTFLETDALYRWSGNERCAWIHDGGTTTTADPCNLNSRFSRFFPHALKQWEKFGLHTLLWWTSVLSTVDYYL